MSDLDQLCFLVSKREQIKNRIEQIIRCIENKSEAIRSAEFCIYHDSSPYPIRAFEFDKQDLKVILSCERRRLKDIDTEIEGMIKV